VRAGEHAAGGGQPLQPDDTPRHRPEQDGERRQRERQPAEEQRGLLDRRLALLTQLRGVASGRGAGIGERLVEVLTDDRDIGEEPTGVLESLSDRVTGFLDPAAEARGIVERVVDREPEPRERRHERHDDEVGEHRSAAWPRNLRVVAHVGSIHTGPDAIVPTAV